MLKKEIKKAFLKKKETIEDVLNSSNVNLSQEENKIDKINRIYSTILDAMYSGQIGKYLHLVRDKSISEEKEAIFEEVLKLKTVFIK